MGKAVSLQKLGSFGWAFQELYIRLENIEGGNELFSVAKQRYTDSKGVQICERLQE